MRPSEAARDTELSARLLASLRAYSGPAVAIMEVCGTHTVAIARMAIRELLPPDVRLLSGPGCPVCVTPIGTFDEAIHLVLNETVILASYGDALRVPGSEMTLADAKTRGGDVRVVYSAMDALEIARQEPGRQIVFLGLGFETTAPTVAWTVKLAQNERVGNFSVLSAHKALIPAMEVLLQDPDVGIGAFLCPGHASMVLGAKAYRPLVEKYGVPCAVAGFEPNDILVGLLRILHQVERGEARVENAYPRAVDEAGNPFALAILEQVFTRADTRWRGFGLLSGSGYELGEAYAEYDARARFLGGEVFVGREPAGCRCAEVLQGKLAPAQCSLFGILCTPESPVGACMVSSEGACGAHHRYRGA